MDALTTTPPVPNDVLAAKHHRMAETLAQLAQLKPGIHVVDAVSVARFLALSHLALSH